MASHFKSLGKLIIKIVYNPTLQQRSKREVWKALFYICLLKMAINLKKRHFLKLIFLENHVNQPEP